MSTIGEIISKMWARCEAATPGPWEFRGGNDRDGDACDLLMAEIGRASVDEDEEWTEVLFGAELADAERQANWELCRAARTDLPNALKALEILLAGVESLRTNAPWSVENILERAEAALKK